MKKILYVALSLILLLTAAGCQSKDPVDENAIALYQDGFEKLTKLESGEIYAKMLMNFEDTEMKYRIKMEGDGSFINRDKNFQSTFNLTAAMNGLKVNDMAKLYTNQGVIYWDVMDNKQKINFDLAFLGSLSITDKKQAIKNMKQMLKAASIKEKDDGTKKVIIKFNPDFMQDYLSTFNQLNPDAASAVDDSNYSYKKMQLNISLDKDDRIKKVLVEMEFSLGGDEELKVKSTDFEIEMTLQMKRENKVDEIPFPPFDDFVEYTKNNKHQLPDEDSDDEYWGDLYDEGEDDSLEGIDF